MARILVPSLILGTLGGGLSGFLLSQGANATPLATGVPDASDAQADTARNSTWGSGDYLTNPVVFDIPSSNLFGGGDPNGTDPVLAGKVGDACNLIGNGSPPDKSDFEMAIAGQPQIVSGHVYEYLGFTRQSAVGNAGFEFEFNQSTSGCAGTSPLRLRTANDFMVEMQLSGTSIGSVFYLTWTGDSTAGTWVQHSFPANTVQDSVSTDGLYGEMVVDLTAAGVFPGVGCTEFGYITPTSSSSGSGGGSPGSDDIKDFLPGRQLKLSNCRSVDLTKVDNNGAPLAGASFTLYKELPPAEAAGSGPGPEDNVAQGSCGPTDSTTGTCSIDAVPGGDYWAVETTTPNGYSTAPPQLITMPSGPGADVTASFTDNPVNGTITVKKTDQQTNAVLAGAGFSLYANGTTAPDPAKATAITSCTSDATGTCGPMTVAPATYWLEETTTPNGYQTMSPQQVTLGLGATPGHGAAVTVNVADPEVPGTINIHKTDGNGNPLQGAVFTRTPAGQTCSTDANGNCTFTSVPLGNYTISETTTPAGYTTAANQKVTIGLGGAPNTGDTETLNFTNVATKGSIVINKTDAQTGATLNGAGFSLFGDAATAPDPAATKALATCTTSGSGTCTFSSLTPGAYWVEETTTPNGYTTVANQHVTVPLGSAANTGATVTLNLADNETPGTLTINKTDSHTGAALAGAGFTLYNDSSPFGGSRGAGDTTTGKTCTSNANGTCTFSSVLPGHYWVVETTTPAGYSTAADTAVTVPLGSAPNQGPTVTIGVANDEIPGAITINKTDAQTGKALSGATFGLFADGANPPAAGATALQSCTTSSGTCSLTGVFPGTYWLAETGTPAGYSTVAAQKVTVAFGTAANTAPVTVVVNAADNEVPGTIAITKTDTQTGKALAGAGFSLFADARVAPAPTSTSLQTCTSNSAGACDFTSVLPGTYWAEETTTPNGYKTVAAQHVTVPFGASANTGSTVTLNLSDDEVPGTVVINKTGVGGAALSGAGFTLYGDQAHTITIGSCTTAANGSCSITNVPLGLYYLAETTTPNGYATVLDTPVAISSGTAPNTGDTQTVNLSDPPVPGTIVVHKTDGTTGQPLAGATFGLYPDGATAPDPTTKPLQSCTSDAKGDCTFSSVALGTYWVVETAVPTGYSTSSPQKATVGLGSAPNTGQTVTLSASDPRLGSSIQVAKTVNGDGTTTAASPLVVENGAPLTYVVTVTNNGQLPLTITALADNLKANLPASCQQGLNSTLAVGASFTCTYTTTAASDAANVATSTGTDQFGRTVSGQSGTFVHVLHPAIDIKKSATPAAHVGDTVTYTLAVTNPGDAGLTPVVVTDALCSSAPALQSKTGGNLDATLDPGETWTYTCSHVVTAADATPLVNTANASGTDVLGTVVTKSGSASTNILTPAIGITKSGPAQAHVGDTLTYTLKVTNGGNTPLTTVVVTDPKCSSAPVLQSKTGGNQDNVLDPGETWTYTCSYVVQASDGTSVVNTAGASGVDPLGSTLNATAAWTTTVLHPAISITKTANPISITNSGPVTYTYVVTNTGDATLTNVNVTDDVLGPIGSIGTLAPGASATLTKTVTVTTSTPPVNTGTATGVDPMGQTVTASAKATISVVLGEAIVPPAPPAPPAVVPAPPAVAPETLPRTGAPLTEEAELAIIVLLLGVLLVRVGRRRTAPGLVTDDQ